MQTFFSFESMITVIYPENMYICTLKIHLSNLHIKLIKLIENNPKYRFYFYFQSDCYVAQKLHFIFWRLLVRT